MRLDEIHARLVKVIRLIILEGRRRLETEERGLLLHSPKKIIDSIGQRLEFHKESLCRVTAKQLKDRHMDLALLDKRIQDLSPTSVLKRGYSITRTLPAKKVLKKASAAQKGDRVQVLLSQGDLTCRVERIGSSKDRL
jgi:exodeoxyribonuclease VII large subunit